MFSSFSFVSWKNRQKLIMVFLAMAKSFLISSPDFLGVFCVREKAFN